MIKEGLSEEVTFKQGGLEQSDKVNMKEQGQNPETMSSWTSKQTCVMRSIVRGKREGGNQAGEELRWFGPWESW